MTDTSPISANHHLPERAASLLAEHGFANHTLEGFVADASPRRYFRIAGENVLLMDDTQDPEGFAAYCQISDHLNGLGLSAPRVLHARKDACLALIEDFGDDTYARCLARGLDEAGLYRLAVDALLALHHHPEGHRIGRPHYDRGVHLDEVSIFSHWFAPAIKPDLDIAAFDATFRAHWQRALSPVANRHETLVLRDFHVDNLMLLDQRQDEARCGLLDFQDAILGPCEYDLVSLLQDARRDLAPGLEEACLAHYCQNAPAHLGSTADIRQRYALLGAQRHARILGVFVRLCLRDGKPRYLAFMPRVLHQFHTALHAAGLHDIAEFLDTALPGWHETARHLPTTLRHENGQTV